MDINFWLDNKFTIDNVPNWVCPTCNNGFLKLMKNKFHYVFTNESECEYNKSVDYAEFIKYRFHGALECDNCDDITVFLGSGVNEPDIYIDEKIGLVHCYTANFTPEYFNPPLNIFNVTNGCPSEIKEEIQNSFKLFFSDLPSSANKIRLSLELLMNNQRVKKTIVSKKGRRRKLTLHERIIEYKKTKSDVADFLLAIKWIGNNGSHIGEMNKIALLNAYQLLNHSLKILFDKHENELKKISKEILKRKGKNKK